MQCPFCRIDNDKVVDTRPSDDGAMIRRRRECIVCGKRFTTHERLFEMPVKVVKKSGERETFSREKILRGLGRALEKRPVSNAEIDRMVSEIEAEVLSCSEQELSTTQIGELVMKKLHSLDAVAYVRFASVYRKFKAVDEFVQAIRESDQKSSQGGE